MFKYYNVKIKILKWLVESYIDLKGNYSETIIDSREILKDEKPINKYYDEYLIKYSLKAKRDCNKSISKLEYLLKEIIGIKIDVKNGKRFSQKINEERIEYKKYNLKINDKIDRIISSFKYEPFKEVKVEFIEDEDEFIDDTDDKDDEDDEA